MGSQVPQWQERYGPRPHCCCCHQVSCGGGRQCGHFLKSGSCVLLPLLLLGSLKLWAQLPQSDNWDCRHQLRCSLSSMCSSPHMVLEGLSGDPLRAWPLPSFLLCGFLEDPVVSVQ